MKRLPGTEINRVPHFSKTSKNPEILKLNGEKTPVIHHLISKKIIIRAIFSRLR
jgi:hypothetical protein